MLLAIIVARHGRARISVANAFSLRFPVETIHIARPRIVPRQLGDSEVRPGHVVIPTSRSEGFISDKTFQFLKDFIAQN
jgi:hypothetical protein